MDPSLLALPRMGLLGSFAAGFFTPMPASPAIHHVNCPGIRGPLQRPTLRASCGAIAGVLSLATRCHPSIGVINGGSAVRFLILPSGHCLQDEVVGSAQAILAVANYHRAQCHFKNIFAAVLVLPSRAHAAKISNDPYWTNVYN